MDGGNGGAGLAFVRNLAGSYSTVASSCCVLGERVPLGRTVVCVTWGAQLHIPSAIATLRQAIVDKGMFLANAVTACHCRQELVCFSLSLYAARRSRHVARWGGSWLRCGFSSPVAEQELYWLPNSLKVVFRGRRNQFQRVRR